MTITSLAAAEALDGADPLAPFRARFSLPEGVIYLDGNSLGPLPRATQRRIATVIDEEWGRSLIRSWNEHDWIDAPRRIGDKIGALIGAEDGSVVAADSTSVNLFKLIVAAAHRAPERAEILTEAGNFPTDLYIARQAAALLGKDLRVASRGDIEQAICERTALVILTHVHYRTGERYDMRALTAAANAAGTRIVWDLSHSVGAVPLALARDGVELAIGCGYKYLNGGPGAPAFLHVAPALQPHLQTPIAGWLGHAEPFAFDDAYRPAPGVERFFAGTPPMLSLLALECGVDLTREACSDAIWDKSCKLFDLFADRMALRCPDMICVTPRDPISRGSHISFAHDDAYAIVQALIERGVIGDFRAPDVARFGLTPLTLSFADVWHAVEILADILDRETWREPRFAARGRVT